jgi:putative endonuclease
MPYVYILECEDKSFYTGSTWDLERRVIEHNEGIATNYTSKRIPVKLVYSEYFDSISQAYEREKQIQRWSRIKKIALINGDLISLIENSKPKN